MSARAVSHVVPDPLISVGRFRVLQRTDALFIVYDGHAAPGFRTVLGKTFTSADEARHFASTLNQGADVPPHA